MTHIARREYGSVVADGPWTGAEVFIYPDPRSSGWHIELVGWDVQQGHSFGWDVWADDDEALSSTPRPGCR